MILKNVLTSFMASYHLYNKVLCFYKVKTRLHLDLAALVLACLNYIHINHYISRYNPSSTEVTSSTSGYTVTTSAYGTPSGHIISTLLKDATIAADATYTCKVSFDSGANSYEIASTAYIELISLNPVDTATVGGSGSSATVTCSLTDSGKTYDSFGWFDSTGTAVVTGGAVTVNVPVYSSGSVATLVVSEPTVDVSYTCKVKYQSDGSNDLSETAIIDFMGKYSNIYNLER